jgi:peptidylprolyl isomerase
MTRSLVFFAILLAVPALARSEDKIDPEKMTKTDSGLKYKDLKEGKGAKPTKGQKCEVHYTGWLWEDGKKGKKFDSSVDRGKTFSFRVGEGQVIQGWDEGVGLMKVGTKRLLLIPPDLAYGESGAGSDIPANATLLFEVELISAK